MVIACTGCHSRQDPLTLSNDIESEILHGDLSTALAEANEAIKQFGGGSQKWDWRFRILKAQILISQSRPEEALSLLRVDLPTALSSSDMAVKKPLFQGIAHTYDQKFEDAEREISEAERLAYSFQPQLLSEILNARGALEVAEKKDSKAEETFRQALAMAREQNESSQEARSLGNLAFVAISLEHYDQAIDRSQEALRLARALGMQSVVATSLGNLGWAYFQLGDFESSLEFFRQGEDMSEKSGLTGYGAYWLTGIANAYQAERDYRSAEMSLDRALEVGRRLDDKQTITTALNALALICLKTGRLDQAEHEVQEALKLEEAGLDHFGPVQSRILSGRIEASKRNFGAAEMLFVSVLADPKVDTPSRWEAKARLAKLHDDQGFPKKAEKEYRESIEAIKAARASVNHENLRLSFLSNGIEFYDDYISFLVAHGRDGDALEVAELSRAQTLEEGLRSSATIRKHSAGNSQPQQIAERLHARLFFYWLGEKRSYLWAITPMKTTCLMLPPSSEIDGVVKSYREAVATSKDVAETERAAGEKLYATLVSPAEKLIPKNSRVILLPDGSLYSLNFETLIVPGSKPHFWIEDVTITTASSLSLLASAASRPPAKQKNLLLVGDTLKANDEFEPLPQAEDEMKIVEGYFPESNRTVLKLDHATPSAYLSSHPERYTYLHFVTHGTASRAQPLESAVIMSKEPASDTYKLYARDIVTRHLNAELVTISACNGSGTRAYSGEGLVGLSWAFVRAGAHNVIAALWEVSNAPSTSELMDSFYKGLSRGQDPASALRDAKLSFLRSSNPRAVFKKPYYWAPFQLYSGS
jgi:CHAT domain-containing protein/Tfp pilus assembly protein PilF